MESEPVIEGQDSECADPGVETGALVHTACGGVVQYSLETPCVCLDDQLICFCLPVCKSDFEKDPAHSCLAIQRRDDNLMS